MCGVAGFLQLVPQPPPDVHVAQKMAVALRHRGPDDAGAYADDHVALAVQRLAIVAPEAGRQPLFNETKSIVLIGNGEIYDYERLREDLSAFGHRFGSESDLEVVIHLYESDGLDFVARLNGQFALALWDRNRRRLIVARDHFGISPLFYAHVGKTLIFASEIKALLQHPMLDPEIDLVGLDQVITFPGLVSPRTMFRGIKSLPPGCLIVADEKGVAVKRYWDLEYPATDEASAVDEADACADLKSLFARAVQRRLQGEAAIGIFLSGGLDSSLIAATMRRLIPSIPINAYCATFPGRHFDESRFQTAAAARFGLRHRPIAFDPATILGGLREMVWHAECAVRESYNVCSLALSRAAQQDGLKVVLCGEGADELFGGYPGYRVDQMVGSNKSLLIDDPTPGSSDQLWATGRLRYERNYPAFRNQVKRLYSPELRRALDGLDCLSQTEMRVEALRGRDILHQRSYLDVKLRLGDHLLGDHGDRMLYASGIEGRFPFLDLDLVRYAVALRPSLKLRNGVEKYILRRIAEHDLPNPLRFRQKYGFRAPGAAELLIAGGEQIEDLLSPDRIRRDGYFDSAMIEKYKKIAKKTQCHLDPLIEDDFLMIIITFNLLLDEFQRAEFN
jgi:asparagine synthase (glutamine-hydrolysing)